MTIVVKIGGSLTREAAPRRLLDHLLDRLAGRDRLVLVPGGGALADTVRAVQPLWGLSDGAAHRMALLAMEQMAHAFADLAPTLRPARTPAEIAAAARAGVALWFPAAMTLGRPDIPEGWAVTSDSLALWLAAEIRAARLVLVKAPGAPVPPPAADRVDRLADRLAAWTRAGLVDAAFATMAQRYGGDILLVPADASDRLASALARCETARSDDPSPPDAAQEGAPPP